MASFNVQLNQYNHCISAYGKARDCQNAVALLNQLKLESRAAPNETSYALAMKACRTAGDWQGALELLRELEAEHPRIERRREHFEAAIGACNDAGQWEHAHELQQQLAQLHTQNAKKP